jgi:hypothetical protein
MQDRAEGPSENLRALWEFLDRSSRQWHQIFEKEEPPEETGFELADTTLAFRR